VVIASPALLLLSGCDLPAGFRQEVVADGFELPTTFVVSPVEPDVQYVAEKAGVVRVVEEGAVRAAPLVDLRDRVNDVGDRGLVGMALDPGFATNGLLYLAYTYQDPVQPVAEWRQTQRVTRLVVDLEAHTADPASEHVVLGAVTGAACWDAWETPDCLPSNLPVHTVGDLGFDGGGTLWVSVGDGGLHPHTPREVSYRAQDLDVLAGKVLRIDPTTGLGVDDNPFYDPADPASNRSRVYAYGFRNPFRFTFRPGSDTAYVGDVGNTRYEEIDVVRAGGNYGWPCYEGPIKQSEYRSQPFCQAMYSAAPVVAPAAFYEHSDQGVSITGGVFYAGTSNYPADHIGSYVYGDYNAFVRRQRFDAGGVAVGEPSSLVAKNVAGAPVRFGIGPDGNVWYLSIFPGELRRIVYAGDAATTPTTTSPEQPGSAPAAAVTAPADRTRVNDGAVVQFLATATDAEDGVLPTGSVTVDVAFVHHSSGTSHVHPYQTFPGITSGSFVASGAHGPGHFTITARATDSTGRTATSPPVNVCLVGELHGPCT
jgi:glucose/arabinose dehydrogenase